MWWQMLHLYHFEKKISFFDFNKFTPEKSLKRSRDDSCRQIWHARRSGAASSLRSRFVSIQSDAREVISTITKSVLIKYPCICNATEPEPERTIRHVLICPWRLAFSPTTGSRFIDVSSWFPPSPLAANIINPHISYLCPYLIYLIILISTCPRVRTPVFVISGVILGNFPRKEEAVSRREASRFLSSSQNRNVSRAINDILVILARTTRRPQPRLPRLRTCR